MARHNAEWWAERVEELRSQGDAEAIARRYKVRARTLIWWRAELARRAREGKRGGPRLLPVVLGAEPKLVASERPHAIEIVVEVGAARMSARGAVTAEHLAAVVGKLVERC